MIPFRHILGLLAVGMCVGVASGSTAGAETVRSTRAAAVRAPTSQQQLQFARLLISRQTSLIASEARTLNRASALIRQQNPIVTRVEDLMAEAVGNPAEANRLAPQMGALWNVANQLQARIYPATRLAVSTQGLINLNFARLDPATLQPYPNLLQQWEMLQHQAALTQVESSQLGARPAYGLAAGTPSR